MKKTERQALIREMIKGEKIATQDQLIKTLQAKGVQVTQATASRDIKELMLAKVSDGNDKYYYIAPNQPEQSAIRKSVVLRHSVNSIVSNELMVIIHTAPGAANAVAFALDNMQIPEILGSIAGDDTVFLALRDRDCRKSVEKRLLEL